MKEGYSKYQRLNIPGHAHELTFSCYRNQPNLTIEGAKEALAMAIEKAAITHQFSLWAYVFMPDHVHMMIFPKVESYSISDILKSIKQPVSISVIYRLKKMNSPILANLKTGLERPPYRFWQDGGGYDRNYWSTEEIREKIEYIHNNPVRKGLVDTAVDWEWSSARDWMIREGGRVRIDRGDFPVT